MEDQTEDSQRILIVDIDGTVAINNGHRGFFDWKKVGGDSPNIPVIIAVAYFDLPVIYVSGRDEECREETCAWLAKHCGLIEGIGLLMRPNKDYRKDSIVKEELYRKHIEGKYEVVAVFDDRNQVVEMWRSLGLLCLQVAPGDF